MSNLTPEQQKQINRAGVAILEALKEAESGDCPNGVEADTPECVGNCFICWALSKRDESGQPMIAVIDQNQEVPQSVYMFEDNKENELELSRHSQMEMIAQGWRKVIPPASKEERYA